jgi:sulfide:quinone oxidoreductase
LITGKGKLILAEFDGNSGALMETFPWDQSKESMLMYYVKKDIMPLLYWKGILK